MKLKIYTCVYSNEWISSKNLQMLTRYIISVQLQLWSVLTHQTFDAWITKCKLQSVQVSINLVMFKYRTHQENFSLSQSLQGIE